MLQSTIKSMPIWKWSLLLVLSLVLVLLMSTIVQFVFMAIHKSWIQWPFGVAASAGMIGLYALFVRWFEKLKAKDIPFKRLAQDMGKGFGIGFCFFACVALIMTLLGLYRIDSIGTDEPLHIVSAFFLFLLVAIGEEITFRGVLFRWIDEKWGYVAALIVSSVLFGFIHIPPSHPRLLHSLLLLHMLYRSHLLSIQLNHSGIEASPIQERSAIWSPSSHNFKNCASVIR